MTWYLEETISGQVHRLPSKKACFEFMRDEKPGMKFRFPRKTRNLPVNIQRHLKDLDK